MCAAVIVVVGSGSGGTCIGNQLHAYVACVYVYVCLCVSFCAFQGERQRSSGPFLLYNVVERVSFAPYKSHFHFYFRWLNVPRDLGGNSALC